MRSLFRTSKHIIHICYLGSVETGEVENGQSATWSEGENVVTITVSGGAPDTVYTVTVTAGE